MGTEFWLCKIRIVLEMVVLVAIVQQCDCFITTELDT